MKKHKVVLVLCPPSFKNHEETFYITARNEDLATAGALNEVHRSGRYDKVWAIVKSVELVA